jgi:hypothetical protein
MLGHRYELNLIFDVTTNEATDSQPSANACATI